MTSSRPAALPALPDDHRFALAPFGALGHDVPVGALQRAIQADRLHHAWLFTGPDGVGKRLVAEALACLLNCLDPTAQSLAVPCGVCRACTRILDGRHPDVLTLAPDTSKARWVIKIEAIRQVTRQVRYKPYEGRHRVVLIDAADTLTIEGANAFLKTLEEPTGDTIFVLLTHQPQRLLDTIRSRCQGLRFAPLSHAIIADLLTRRGVTAERAQIVAGYADGSAGDALALSEEGVLDDRRELIQTLQHLAADNDNLAVFQKAQALAKRPNAELQMLLDGLRVFYRDVVLCRAQVDPRRLVNADLYPLIHRTASALTLERALGHIEAIDRTQSDLRAYVDARLLMEQLLLRLTRAELVAKARA